MQEVTRRELHGDLIERVKRGIELWRVHKAGERNCAIPDEGFLVAVIVDQVLKEFDFQDSDVLGEMEQETEE